MAYKSANVAAMATDKRQLKTVIVTGGATGIGFKTAELLLAERDHEGEAVYRVAIIGKSKERLNAAAEKLGKYSDYLSIHICDLSNPKLIFQTSEKITGTFKNIYGLVNNAGIYPFGNLTTTELNSWDETFDVNLKAPFLLTKFIAPAMVKTRKGGRVVNISSTAGILPNHHALAYSVSKAALIELTKTLAKELGKDHITVNCLCPGIVRTPLHDAYMNNHSEAEAFYAKRGSAYPLGRVGESLDVACAIRFYLSNEACWITGDVMVIDGGRLLT